jgi:hypothetical protein
VDHPWLVAEQIAKIAGKKDLKLLAEHGFQLGRSKLVWIIYQWTANNNNMLKCAEHSGKMRALRELLVECQIGGAGEQPQAAGTTGRRRSAEQRGEDAEEGKQHS